MSKARFNRSVQFYDLLLKFYPEKYRNEFGSEMRFVFSESLKDARLHQGTQGLITLWIRTLLDAGKSIVTQHAAYKKGGGLMKKSNDFLMQNKVFLWLILAVGAVLTIPIIARFPWTGFDFIVAAIVLILFGSAFVFAARKWKKNRLIVAIIVAVLFVYVWAELAVGIFTNIGS